MNVKIYNRIPYWENRKRVGELSAFRDLVIRYFQNIDYPDWSSMNRELVQNREAMNLRPQINKASNRIHAIFDSSRLSTQVYHTPAPAVGGFAGYVDLIDNLFRLHIFDISNQELIDLLDRNIGIYEEDKMPSFIRIINPFHWLFELVDYIVSIPFKILGRVGFQESKIEESKIGKAVKGILYLVTVFAAFLTILYYLGLLEGFKASLPK